MLNIPVTTGHSMQMEPYIPIFSSVVTLNIFNHYSAELKLQKLETKKIHRAEPSFFPQICRESFTNKKYPAHIVFLVTAATFLFKIIPRNRIINKM